MFMTALGQLDTYALRFSDNREPTHLIHGWMELEETTDLKWPAQCAKTLHDLLDGMPVFSFSKPFDHIMLSHRSKFHGSTFKTKLFELVVIFVVEATEKNYSASAFQDASKLKLLLCNE
jgi:hypothetical protein